MSTHRLLTIFGVIALAAVGVFVLQAFIENARLTSNQAGVYAQTTEQQAVSAIRSGNAELEKVRALEDHYRKLYPQAFADAEFAARWAALAERYRALYPEAHAAAALGTRWGAMEERYRTL